VTLVIFALLTSKIAQIREDFQAATFEPGPTRRDRSNITVAGFLAVPRRIAQERVPTAFNVGSRDVTWASRATPLIPFRVFSRVSRAPHSLGKAGRCDIREAKKNHFAEDRKDHEGNPFWGQALIR
jgi:hypothetical protein